MDDLRKQLDLDDKYFSTRKKIKRLRNNIKKKNWSVPFKIIVIAIPVIVIIIINMALGGLFEYSVPKNETVNMPAGKKVEVKLENNSDPDTDGITTKEEIDLGTNPFNRDTDGDGVTDDGELNLGLNPLEYNRDILIDAYQGINGNKYDLPVNYNNFVIRADSIKSRAYLTAISDTLPDGMTINKFNVSGTVEGNGYVLRKDGFFEKTSKAKSKDKVFIKTGEAEEITTLKVFGKNIPVENLFLRGICNFFLPKHGMIAAFDNLKSDYSPDSVILNNEFSDSNMEYARAAIDNLSDTRFNLLHNDTLYKDRLVTRLKAGEIVPVSVISGGTEYLIFITGQYSDGNFLAVDAKSKKEIGKLYLEKEAVPVTDGQNLVQIETLKFKLGDLNSDNARLIFL